MITVIILAAVALVIATVTVVTAARDGYGRTPDRMSTSNLEQRTRSALGESTSASRLA